jgi:reductive dehalogenase
MAELQNFMRTLGYMCLGQQAAYNGLAQATAFAVLSGLGELARVGHLITPDFGLMQRVHVCITDLPLAPGKPVDFGVWNFCRTCKKCAEHCPVKAIGSTTEPTWDTDNASFRSPGVKRWMLNEPRCVSYYLQVGNCSRCFGVCPYSHRSNSAMYDIFRWSVSNNRSLNRFWRKTDDFFYGIGTRQDIDKIWELDLPPWGYN